MVYLPTFPIFHLKKQPNVGKYTNMDGMGKFDWKHVPPKLNLWYILLFYRNISRKKIIKMCRFLALNGRYKWREGPLYINGPKINGFAWGYFTWLTGGLYPWQWLKGGIWGGWIATENRSFHLKWWFLVREMVPEIFHGNLGWWNMISVGQKYDFWISNNKQLVFCGLGYVHGINCWSFLWRGGSGMVFWKLRSWVNLIANPFINGWLSNRWW